MLCLLCFFVAHFVLSDVRIRDMDVLLPASTLVLGLAVGAFCLWLLARAERATLIERLNGKESQLRDFTDALDREKDESERLRGENAANLANLLALQTRARTKLAHP